MPSLPRTSHLVAVVLVGALALSGCSPSATTGSPEGSPTTVATSLPGPVGNYLLFIHCGVRYTTFDGDNWEAVEPIPSIAPYVLDGKGNGRSRNEIAGEMVRLSPTEARFTSTEDPKGVVIHFVRMTTEMPLCT